MRLVLLFSAVLIVQTQAGVQNQLLPEDHAERPYVPGLAFNVFQYIEQFRNLLNGYRYGLYQDSKQE